MEYFFQLGSVKFSITADEFTITKELDHFCAPVNEQNIDVRYTVTYDAGIKKINGEVVAKGMGYEVYSTEKGFVYSYNVGTTFNPYKAYLYMENMPYRLMLPEEHRKELEKGYNISTMLGIEQILLKNQHIMMHASIVRYKEKGILFSGPSGVGKSTQAELWKKYRGAEIINGDRAILYVSDLVTAFGSPYAGSSGIVRKESVPVNAIVFLHKASENRIERRNGNLRFGEMYQRFAVTPWNEELCNIGMNLICRIMHKVPVYDLFCRPDEGAVLLLERAVFD